MANGTLPASKQSLPRRATVVAIDEEESTPVPAVAPAPATLPPSELAEEEPDAPPEEQRPEIVEAPEEPEPETPKAPVADTVVSAPAPPTITVADPEGEEVVEEPEPEAPEPDAPEVEEPSKSDDDLDELVNRSAAPVVEITPPGNESMEDVGL